MDIQLQANADYALDLGVAARKISIVNPSSAPIYVRKNITASASNCDYVVSPGCTSAIDFLDDNCQQVHLFCSQDKALTIEVLSIFKSIHRGDAAANTEVVVDFKGPCQHYDIQNIGAGTMYFSIDCQASIDGPQTLELQPGSGYSADEPCTTISIISSVGTRYQIKGRR